MSLFSWFVHAVSVNWHSYIACTSSLLCPAAGGSVEPFWGLYQQHMKPEILKDVLEPMRIGNLKGAMPAKKLEDPYANEPKRHPALVIRSSKPFNAETPPDLLAAALITPVDMFYVRNHLPVPKIDEQTYILKVGTHP